MKERQGFTLIELSIVLVIIGLLVGGVLVGRDMVAASQLRGTMSQVLQYDTAVSAFRNKYDAFPGDLSSVKAATFGFVTRTGAEGHGDENRQMESCAAGLSGNRLGCETLLFWSDLARAGLIEGSYSLAVDNYASGSTIPKDNIPQYIPVAKIPNNYFTVWFNAVNTRYNNRYALIGLSRLTALGTYNPEYSLTTLQAYNIDMKMDDGNPNVGSVFPLRHAGANFYVYDASQTCVSSTAYLTDNEGLLCSLNIVVKSM